MNKTTCKYKVTCQSLGFNEQIVVCDLDGNEVARSGEHHPEGWKTFHYDGFEFLARPYGADKECYVNVSDKILFEKVIKPYKKVQFKELNIGDEFECYGDININYDYPKICKCKKTGGDEAQEIDGVSFFMNGSDEIFIKNT